jgi:hypothetical protein
VPVFGNRAVRALARGIKLSFSVEVGIMRAGEPEYRLGSPAPPASGETEIRPENLIWIFGAGRTGSTWLMRMMGSLERYSRWSEPMLGELFGSFHSKARKDQLPSKQYILSDLYRESWLRSIRGFVLDGARTRYPGLTTERYLVIKESTGSDGAPLLVEALPESRVILRVRDPRDVVASHMDASKRGSWMYQLVGDPEHEAEVAGLVEHQPDQFVKEATELLMKNMVGAKRAYEAHRGPKVLVRYEELLADHLGTMRRIFATLGLPADEEELARVVEKHSWENIPEDEKGTGKFFRRAEPGSWREDLTPEQIETVERMAAPILNEFYPEKNLAGP